ncbi:MAG: Rpn family recombination-promoting nuclease/putative transposase [Methylococcales bacterium]|nr:Rpn family recombination-promoting nuclease/putative transposase [Methylococcales bacterium]MDD5755449.1 Rpn family recombination-promoting nuclease/putative transposase [Methylococcales bacterium]
MKQVASLQYGVIFKKAFSQLDVFKAFVKDIIGIELEIDKVETEKSFEQKIVKVEFDLYAEDLKNRVIIEIQHQNGNDYYDRFLHYHCVALLEQAAKYSNYKPDLTVYTIVVLTSADKHKTDVAVIDFDPKDRYGNSLGEIKHKVIYLAVKYVDENTPEIYREWLSAIKESLTEQIEETNYHRPELQTVINSIAKNLVSPEEKYAMIEEYNFETDKKKKFDEGIQQGIQQGEKDKALAIAKGMLSKRMDIQTIAELTGLTHVEIENLQRIEGLE